jgi:hypothetical protein
MKAGRGRQVIWPRLVPKDQGVSLEEAAESYKMFKNQQDEVTRVVLRPS